MREKILMILAEICEDDSVMEDTGQELFESGILDSMAFAEFLVELEDRLGVVIAPSQVEREDIDTPDKLVAMIEERL